MSRVDLAERARQRRRELLDRLEADRVRLPPRLLAQQAHYTTPAGDDGRIRKAVQKGWLPLLRILAGLEITAVDLGRALTVPADEVERLLEEDPRAPLVVVDGEDAQAGDPVSLERGRTNAIHAFRELEWKSVLRFYRPAGLRAESSIDDLVRVLMGAGRGRDPAAYPIDGIVFPKVERPEEVEWLTELLAGIEEELGLDEGRIRVELLVESGAGVLALPEVARRAGQRLAGLVFGSADFSADLGLPTIRNDHPACDWARTRIAAVAGALGVPAIDAMTLQYPVVGDVPEHRRGQMFLERLKRCYDDALHGIDMGMKGKWVGHPAQLFVTLLAFRRSLADEELERDLEAVRAYREAVEEGEGVTTIGGQMADRATDRHVRRRLREAWARGLVSTEEAVELEIVTLEEARTAGRGREESGAEATGDPAGSDEKGESDRD